MTEEPVVVPEAQKPIAPVYKTGNSLGEIFKHNEQVEIQSAAQPATTAAPPETTATPETPATTVTAPATTEENVVSFAIDDFSGEGQQPEGTPAQPAVTDWREEAKKDIAATLKELGVSDFAIEMDKHIRNGGKPVDYLSAKAIDYNQISDEALIKDDLKRQFPNFTQPQIDLYFNRKYKPADEANEEDVQFAELQLKADAHTKRQQRIEEQSKFKIAEPLQPTAANEYAEDPAEIQRQIEQVRNWYNEHEATKSLMTSKRVAINLGDDGNFNYNIEKPEVVMKGILDTETWRRMTSTNPKEPDVTKLTPDVAKLQRLVLIASNPNYEKDLVNYGKTLERRQQTKEGQNITAPAKVIPVNQEKKGVDWSTIRTGTVGGK